MIARQQLQLINRKRLGCPLDIAEKDYYLAMAVKLIMELSVQAASLPHAPGTYLLLLRVDSPCMVNVGRLGTATLGLGWVLYVGSAFGPGGLAARLRHHLRPARPAPLAYRLCARRAPVVRDLGLRLSPATGTPFCGSHAQRTGMQHTPAALRGFRLPLCSASLPFCRPPRPATACG